MLKKKSQKIENVAHINFLEVSQSSSTPDKPEQTDNNTGDAGKERKIKTGKKTKNSFWLKSRFVRISVKEIKDTPGKTVEQAVKVNNENMTQF